MGLLDKVAHPRTAVFVASGVKIQIIQCHGFSVIVENLIGHYVRMINRQIFSFFKSNPVEFFGCVEHPFFQNGGDFEIRFYFIFIQIIFRFSYLLRVEIPVPRLHRKSAFLLINQGLNFFAFSPCCFYRRGCKLSQQVHCFFRRLCHLVLQFPFSKRFFTGKVCFFHSQFRLSFQNGSCVIRISFFCPVPGCFEEFFSCRSVL